MRLVPSAVIPIATIIVSPAYSTPSIITTGKLLAVEAAFGQGLDLGGGGPDEVAADAGLRHAEAVACEIDNLFIITSAHATDHAAEHGTGHGIGRLKPGVGLQRDLAATVGVPHPGTCDRHLLPSQGGYAPLMAVPGVRPLGLALVASPAQSGHLVLQETRGDQQTQFRGQRLQGILHQDQEFVSIQGELDSPAGCLGLGPDVSAQFACGS